MLLPKASEQQARDTAAAITPWLGTAAAPCAFVAVSPVHVCTSMPMSIGGSVCAHGHVHAWLQALPLSSAGPSQASIGTGRARSLEQGPGAGFWKLWTAPQPGSSAGKAAVWQPPVHGGVMGWGVSATHPWVQQPFSPPSSGPGVLPLATSLWRLLQLCTPAQGGPCLPLHAGWQGCQGWHHILCWAAPLPFPGRAGVAAHLSTSVGA